MDSFHRFFAKYPKQQLAFNNVKPGQLTFACQLKGSSSPYYSYGNCTLKVLHERICVNHNGEICVDSTGCVNEVISENTTRRMYFDIDIDEPNCSQKDIHIICNAMLKMAILKLHDRNICQMIVLNATTTSKLSLHIIFPEIRVSTRQNLINLISYIFPDFVIANCGRFGNIQVDVSVYNKNSVFRMMYNRKVGKNNALFPIGYVYKPGEKASEEYFKSFEFFKKTIVSTDESPTCDYLAHNESILPNARGTTSKRKRGIENQPVGGSDIKIRKTDANYLSDDEIIQFKNQVTPLLPHNVQQHMKHICMVSFNETYEKYTMFGTGSYKFCAGVGRKHKSNNVMLDVYKDGCGKITHINQYCYKCNLIEKKPQMVLYHC